jgi:hypothetical protein
MAVKKDIFVGYLEKRGIETGRLSVMYNFTGSSGVLIYNNALPTGDHFSGGYIRGDASPGISMGKGDLLETSTAAEVGYAHFDATGSLMQIGTGIDFEDWTMFFSVKQLEEQAVKYGLQRVLVTSSSTPDAISGFSFGIAGNKAFYQYPDTDGIKAAHSDYGNDIKTITNNENLAEHAIISISKQKSVNKLIEISVHDLIEDEVKTKSFFGANDRHSDNWYMGNYSSSTFAHPRYAGFSGYVDDMILVSGFIPENTRHELSKTFSATAYQREGATLQEVSFTKVTGYSTIDYNAVTGTGIIGYDFNKIEDISTQDEDNTPNIVSLYAAVPLIGVQTGQKRIFLTGTETATTVEYVDVPEKTTFSSDIISGYAKDVIIPKDVLDDDDVLEVYSYLTDLTENETSLKPKRIAQEPNDIYKLDEFYSGENINVYKNGVLQTQPPVNLVTGVPQLEYAGIYGTGVYELGPEHGIKKGQTYYVDFTDDYIPPIGEAVSGSIGGVERGLGVLTGLSGTDAENVGTEWNVGDVVHKTRTVTADRDGLLLVHVSAGSERLIQGLRSKVKLDYTPDYILQNSGELESSGKFLVTDDLVYDRTPSGASRYFVWSGQSDNFKLQGSGSDGVMYFYGYNLNVPWDEMYGELGYTNRSDIGSDVYFNGQKMTSGINYTIDYIGGSTSSGFGVKFDMDTLNGATGTVHFAATVSGMGQFNRHTGIGASFFQIPFGLMREQVWVNGVRQEKGCEKDYVKASRFSRLASGKRLGKKTSSIYSTNASTAGSSGFGTY